MEIKKIISREERERKESRNRIIVGIILVGIMVLSTAGYAFFQTDKGSAKKIEYNGIKFSLGEDSFWHFKVQENEFATYYNPQETENISVNIFASLFNYQNKPLYFSYDSRREGMDDISRNLARFLERNPQLACLDNCTENLPIKNCSSDNIILIKEGNESLIKQEENCIYILGKDNDLIKASDAFIFKILGVK